MEPAAGGRAPCPHCGESAALAARLCPHCRQSLLVDVAAAGRLAPREAYAAAREIGELGGPGPGLHTLRGALERGETLLAGATRAEAAAIAEAVAHHGGGVVLLPEGSASPATAAGSRPPARSGGRGAAIWGGAALALLAFLLWTARPAPQPGRQAPAGPEDPPNSPGAPATPARTAAETPLTPQEIGLLASGSTVALRCESSAGSGFFVAPGLVVTNAHVLCGERKELSVRRADGAELTGTVERSDPWLDLALVRVAGVTATPLALGDASALRQGDAVYFYGSPRGLDFTLSRAIVGHNARALRGIAYVQIDGNVNPGNSGGPLLDAGGRVVGIVTMMVGEDSGLGLALPVNYLYDGEGAMVPAPAGADPAAWSALVRAVAVEDQREAAETRRELERAGLAGAFAVRGEVVALVVQQSRIEPFARRLSFVLERDGSPVCYPAGTPEDWREVGSLDEVGIDARTRGWLARHGLEGGVWTATVPLEWAGCPAPPEALGLEIVLDGGLAGADRAAVTQAPPAR